jgi:hypothetical protein
MDFALDAIQLDFEPGKLLALNVILALLMFGVALDLRLDDFRAVLRAPRGPVVGIATQLLLLPPATFLLIQLIDPIPSVKLGMMLVAACPGGNVSNFLVWMARGNTALSVSMTAVTSSAAVLTTPFNLAFWASLDPDTRALLADVSVNAGDMFTTILLLLAVPLCAGMLFRARYPRASAIIQRPLRMVGGAIFLGFIVLAFYSDRAYPARAADCRDPQCDGAGVGLLRSPIGPAACPRPAGGQPGGGYPEQRPGPGADFQLFRGTRRHGDRRRLVGHLAYRRRSDPGHDLGRVSPRTGACAGSG